MKRLRVPLSYPAPDGFDGGSGSLPGWQLCRGISGRLRLESVATLVWNTQEWHHFNEASHFASEYTSISSSIPL